MIRARFNGGEGGVFFTLTGLGYADITVGWWLQGPHGEVERPEKVLNNEVSSRNGAFGSYLRESRLIKFGLLQNWR